MESKMIEILVHIRVKYLFLILSELTCHYAWSYHLVCIGLTQLKIPGSTQFTHDEDTIVSITEHHLQQEQKFYVVQHYRLHYTTTERDPQQSIQLKADPFYLGSTIGIHAC